MLSRYCFGAPYVMQAITGSSPTCEVGAFAHPAFLKEEHFEKITRPLYLSCAEDDFTFNTESRNKALDILIAAKKPYGLQVFSGVSHGFALRCDLSKPYERWCKEQSVRSIVDYFDVQLGLFEKRTEKEK
jgi:dienelactone hydrolase